MGYSSTYELALYDGLLDKPLDEETAEKIIADLRDNNHNAEYALDEEGSTNDSCKWYDSDTDLKEFSKKYPTVLFDLYREGEESGDLSHFYAINGKYQNAPAEVVYPEFDPEKLR